MSQGSYITAAATTAGVLAGAYCVYHLYNETKTSKLPTTWKKVGTLGDISMYPLKSSAGIQMTTAECTYLGLKDGWLRDRMLTVVDDNYNIVTGRVFPKLLLVQTTISNSILTMKCKDMEPLDIDLEQVIDTKIRKEVILWGTRYQAYECGWESNEWFSRYLTKSSVGYRLALFTDSPNKILKFKKTDTGAFADEVPFNLINQASIDDLNTRLNGVKVNHKRFRSNFLLSGAEPYDEDNWKFVKIGENIFEITKPCTSYRQETDPELRRFAGSTPRMGLQMVLRTRDDGIVTVNDSIYVA